MRVTLETDRGGHVAGPATAPFAHHDRTSPLAELVSAYAYPGPLATAVFDDLAVDPWSAEDPTRYRLVVELLDPDSAPTTDRRRGRRLPDRVPPCRDRATGGC